MIKQRIYPQFAKYDIVNSKMPDVFLDPTAKVKIFLYKTNQKFNEIFIDENSEEQRIINFSLDKELDAWVGQNFTKQINPFQSSSASKTIAMQSEIELYILENLQSKIESDFYFFTFSQISNEDDAKRVPKFLIKESISNIDKTKFRFSKLKAWQMSSVLFKQYQYWYFKPSINLHRMKVKQIQIELPCYAGIGNIRTNGTNVIGVPPQNMEYKLKSIIHPFLTMEPIACNFAYKNGNISTQFINWDLLGEAIIKTKNSYFVVDGGTNDYLVDRFNRYAIGLVNELSGATLWPAPAGAIYGLGEAYCSDLKGKDASNDLKAYLWCYNDWTWQQKEYYGLKKCSPVNSLIQYEQFLLNSSPTFSFTPWWTGYLSGTMGEPFWSLTQNVLNEETFEFSNSIVKSFDDVKQYSWLLMGQMNVYDIGVFSSSPRGGRGAWLNNRHYNFGVLPWGFRSVDNVRWMWNTIRSNKQLDKIILNIEFPTPIYLNSIEINVLYADEIKLKIIDVNDLTQNYKQYTNFFLLGQDQVKTKIVFF